MLQDIGDVPGSMTLGLRITGIDTESTGSESIIEMKFKHERKAVSLPWKLRKN